MKPVLRAWELGKTYPSPTEELVVLYGVNLEVSAGESLAITGPSGSGKSTLLHILGALDVPTAGKVDLAGTDPFSLDPRALARFRNQKIGFVFQDHHLLPQCTVLENVLVPTLVSGGVTQEKEEWGRHLLEKVGLSSRLQHLPSEISGGERQRAAIARALIQRPHVLLCDEPTGNLDAGSARMVTELLLDLHEEMENIWIVVTHAPELASKLKRRAELRNGRIEGPAAQGG